MSEEDTVTDLQTRLAFQEDWLDSLNKTVTDQAQVIDDLMLKLRDLESQLRRLADSAQVDPGAPEPPPPHY